MSGHVIEGTGQIHGVEVFLRVMKCAMKMEGPQEAHKAQELQPPCALCASCGSFHFRQQHISQRTLKTRSLTLINLSWSAKYIGTAVGTDTDSRSLLRSGADQLCV